MIRAIRKEAATPIVILSGRFEEREKVEALERGADDYVTKPFGIAELRVRIKVALRHAAGPAGDPLGRLRCGPIEVDVERHEVMLAGRPVALTPREFEILKVLLAHRGRIVTKGRLLRAVWGAGLPGRGRLRVRPREQCPSQAQRRRPFAAGRGPDRHRARRRLPHGG